MVMCKASLTGDLKEALDLFNSELNDLFNDPKKSQKEYLELADKYILDYPDLEMIGGKGTPIYVKGMCEKVIAENTKKHGGKRAGSGRKKKELSPPVRVPKSLHPLVFLLKEIHEDGYKNEESINKAILMIKNREKENQLSLI